MKLGQLTSLQVSKEHEEAPHSSAKLWPGIGNSQSCNPTSWEEDTAGFPNSDLCVRNRLASAEHTCRVERSLACEMARRHGSSYALACEIELLH